MTRYGKWIMAAALAVPMTALAQDTAQAPGTTPAPTSGTRKAMPAKKTTAGSDDAHLAPASAPQSTDAAAPKSKSDDTSSTSRASGPTKGTGRSDDAHMAGVPSSTTPGMKTTPAPGGKPSTKAKRARRATTPMPTPSN